MTNIVVLGAGYAGMAATLSLAGHLRRRDDVRITLINGSDRFTERLRLHRVASGVARRLYEGVDRSRSWNSTASSAS
jgi:NADH dehydrogenase FAD-containing subunit